MKNNYRKKNWKKKRRDNPKKKGRTKLGINILKNK